MLYSKKMMHAIDQVLKPLVDEGGIYHGKVKIIFRPQVQSWHASSTYTHEAGIAVSIVLNASLSNDNSCIANPPGCESFSQDFLQIRVSSSYNSHLVLPRSNHSHPPNSSSSARQTSLISPV